MPTYEYKCGGCGKIIEEFFRMSERKTEVPCACGRLAPRLYNTDALQVFRPYVHHLLDAKPVYMRTKRQEKEEFRKRNLIDAN